MKKSILLIVLMLLASAQSFAQHFDWVRGYAPGDNVAIVGSVTDSVGNLYILGNINFNTCWENGNRLLPIAPYGYARDLGDVLIAKVSPEGDLVWHKVIHGNLNGRMACDIKSIGDTAFACLVEMSPATREYYLYYLDTMIYETTRNWDHNSPYSSIPFPDYPINVDGFTGYEYLALITFDFDGHVLEQHFLQMSYLDYNGEDITCYLPAPYNATWISGKAIAYASFAVDEVGNIYLSRNTYDMIGGCTAADEGYSVDNGTISAVKFWCDRREVGVVPADSTMNYIPQILKFSPHFDTLLEGRYVYQSASRPFASHGTHMERDGDNNLYILIKNQADADTFPCRIVVDSVLRLEFEFNWQRNPTEYVIVKMSPDLETMGMIAIEDTITDTSTFMAACISMINDMVFDEDSNYIIVSCYPIKGAVGSPCDTTNAFFSVNGTRTDFHRDAGVLILDKDNLKLKSYGRLNSTRASSNVPHFGTYGNLACGGNRIFFQSRFSGDVTYPNQTIRTPSFYSSGLCLSVFDYNGNMIEGIDYHATSPSNDPGPLNLVGSTLYLTCMITSDATFGDISVPSRGEYFACIAKYTDRAFMSTYERPEDTTMVVEVVQEEMTVVRYPNPTTGRLTIDMNGRPLREAWVAAIDGVAEPLPVTHLGDSRYAADLTGRPDGTYILVLVADDHRAYRSTIILQH